MKAIKIALAALLVLGSTPAMAQTSSPTAEDFRYCTDLGRWTSSVLREKADGMTLIAALAPYKDKPEMANMVRRAYDLDPEGKLRTQQQIDQAVNQLVSQCVDVRTQS